MSAPLLILTSVIYLGVSIDRFVKGDPWMGAVMLCYCLANLALVMAMK